MGRGKHGWKIHLTTERTAISGANVHDSQAFSPLVQAELRGDKGYDYHHLRAG
ncbi:hypothetical protein AB0O75_02635 [Streptomyces sp. NPDC088921]|uniref:hypothetical protein n=1 Tax=unclassified Streptomyces TaxID=2593676 RepID=UPI00342503DB